MTALDAVTGAASLAGLTWERQTVEYVCGCEDGGHGEAWDRDESKFLTVVCAPPEYHLLSRDEVVVRGEWKEEG